MTGSDAPARVGVVGVGRMGLPIAERLRAAGHDVTVADRDERRLVAAAAAGLATAEAADAVARASDVLVTVLPGASEFRDVMLGPAGAVAVLRPGTLWVDLTSNDPRVAVEAARASIARGVGAVAAPMAGGPEGARSGALGVFLAGAADVLERARPLLDVVTRAGGIRVVGDDVGAAYSAKLLVNLLWFGQVAAVTEALLLGEQLGIPAGTMTDVLAGSAGDSAFVERQLPLLLAGDDMADFPIRACLDELEILAALAAEHETPYDVAGSVTELYRRAVDRYGDADGRAARGADAGGARRPQPPALSRHPSPRAVKGRAARRRERDRGPDGGSSHDRFRTPRPRGHAGDVLELDDPHRGGPRRDDHDPADRALTMRRFLRDNGLSVAFLLIFVLALIGQSLAGLAYTNEELAQHGQPLVSYLHYITSSDFAVDVAENWQSEFLQFFLFILATIWLIQRGSPESKKPGDAGVGTDDDQLVGQHARPDSPSWARTRGIRLWVYSNSLLLVMGVIFLLSWFAQSLAGTVVASDENAEHGLPPLTWLGYVTSADFWNRTLQNWQSEFLAVGAMVAFSIYLRQRGSSESKPVGTPHHTSSKESE